MEGGQIQKQAQQYKVSIIGSGNWGTSIAAIIAENTKKHSSTFHETVHMWVKEEQVDGKNLTDIINTEHENVKYLKGFKIPSNIIATPDLKTAVESSNVFVFVLPHQFIVKVCEQMKPFLPSNTIGISLIKGFIIDDNSKPILISQKISSVLSVPVFMLSGANIASQVISGPFSEAVIASPDSQSSSSSLKLFTNLFTCSRFSVKTSSDLPSVELSGGLKNVVALAAGFIDGLESGENAKAAVMRIGLSEMIQFIKHFYPKTNEKTYLESSGVGDLIVTCYSGRNRKVAEAFVKGETKGDWEKLEKEMLGGQKLQGVDTAEMVWKVLKAEGMEKRYPLFVTVYEIAFEGKDAKSLYEVAAKHAELFPTVEM